MDLLLQDSDIDNSLPGISSCSYSDSVPGTPDSFNNDNPEATTLSNYNYKTTTTTTTDVDHDHTD